MRKKMGRNDWILLGIFGVSALILLLIFYLLIHDTGDFVTITVDGESYGRYDLNKNQEIPVKRGDLICNVVCIADGKAYMKEADCPDHLCVRQGKISADHATIVCLPNRVVVEVSSSGEKNFDSLTR